MRDHYWRFAGFYFFYFAFVGAFAPYWSLYLKSLALSAFQIGVLMSLLQVMRIFSPNAWGWLSDRSGRSVQVVRLASAASLIFYCGVFFGSSFAWLFAVMALMSFFWGGSLPLVEAATMGHLGEATHNYGRIRFWGSVGFVIVVVGLGALLDRVAIGWVPWVVLLLLTCIVLQAFLLPEIRAPEHERESASVWEILRRREVVAFFIACFLMTVAHGPLYVFYSIYLVDHGYGKTAVGVLWSLGVVCEIFVFIYLPRLLQRYALRAVLLASLAAAVVRFLLIGWAADSMALMALAQVLHALTFGSYHGAALSFVHSHFRGRHQAKGQALYTSLSFGAGGALGGLLSGLAWERLGASLTFTIASVCALAGLVVIARQLNSDQGLPT
jgi:MFS transporter, PPP family, 3-phenylpropionic acid transporter